MQEHRFEAVGLSVSTKEGKNILTDIRCRFSAGELAVVTGPSGAGKSYLLRCLAGLITPYVGTVSFSGVPITKKESLKELFYMPADPHILRIAETPMQDLQLTASVIGISAEDSEKKISLAAECLGVSEFLLRPWSSLSTSEAKLCSFAHVWIRDSFVILIDDTFAYMDLRGVKTLLKNVLNWKAAGKIVILVTRDLEKILAHSERLILLKDGRIIADALPERVLPYIEAHDIKKPVSKLSDMTWLSHDEYSS